MVTVVKGISVSDLICKYVFVGSTEINRFTSMVPSFFPAYILWALSLNFQILRECEEAVDSPSLISTLKLIHVLDCLNHLILA